MPAIRLPNIADISTDLTPQLGGDLDLNGHNIEFPTTANISDCLDEDNMVSDSATKLATQQSIKAYVDAHTPLTHHDSHDPEDGSDALDCAAAAEISVVVAASEGSAHSFARSDHVHAINHGITDNHILTVDGTINSGEYLKATANGAEGKTFAEVLGDLSGQATADFAMNSHKITGVTDPTAAQDAATKAYVDAVAQGLKVHDAVACATTANITLSGEQTLDGVTTSTDRVLVRAQTNTEENGIYVSAAGAWARSDDMNAATEVAGSFVFVSGGTAYGSTGWVCTAEPDGFTLGTTAMPWSQFSSAGYVTAGTGLTKTGNDIAISDTELLALAGLTFADQKMIVGNGANTVTMIDCTTFAQSILDDADEATFKATVNLEIGTDVQAFHANLTDIANLTFADDKMIIGTGAGTIDMIDCTAFAQTILDDADAAAVQTTLGLVIGTNVQAYDAELAALAGLTFADDKIILGTGAGTVAMADCTAFAQTILDDADAAAVRGTIEIDTDDAVQFAGLTVTTIQANGAVTVGVDDTGHDVKFFGATAGAYFLFDESEDAVVLQGGATKQMELRFMEDTDNGAHYTAFKAHATMAAAVTYILPDADSSGTQYLTSDGSGNLAWSSPAGSGDVTAAANITDNAIVRGDGGAKGVQDAGVLIDDNDVMSALKGIAYSAFSELTIATGAITVTQMYHTVDTESDAASDDLATINGGATVNLIVLRAAADARTVVVKHNTGNIWLQGKADISLDDLEDGIMLAWDGTKWFDIAAGGGGGGAGSDTTAIHDNVADEIVVITEKTAPVGADEVLIEDSEDSNNKKSAKIENFPVADMEKSSRTIYVDADAADDTGDGTVGDPFQLYATALADVKNIIADGVTITIHLDEATNTYTPVDTGRICIGTGCLTIEGVLSSETSGTADAGGSNTTLVDSALDSTDYSLYMLKITDNSIDYYRPIWKFDDGTDTLTWASRITLSGATPEGDSYTIYSWGTKMAPGTTWNFVEGNINVVDISQLPTDSGWNPGGQMTMTRCKIVSDATGAQPLYMTHSNSYLEVTSCIFDVSAETSASGFKVEGTGIDIDLYSSIVTGAVGTTLLYIKGLITIDISAGTVVDGTSLAGSSWSILADYGTRMLLKTSDVDGARDKLQIVHVNTGYGVYATAGSGAKSVSSTYIDFSGAGTDSDATSDSFILS